MVTPYNQGWGTRVGKKRKSTLFLRLGKQEV